MFQPKWAVREVTLLLRGSESGIEIFGVGTAEVPSVDQGPVEEIVPSRANCE